MALKKLTLERIALEIEMNKKIFQTELEYQERFKEFNEKRRMIVAGDYVPTEDECKYQYADSEDPVVESKEKGIPRFWSTIFANLDLLTDMIHDQDKKVITLITDIRCVLMDNPMVSERQFQLFSIIVIFQIKRDIDWNLNLPIMNISAIKFLQKNIIMPMVLIQLIHWVMILFM